MLAKSAKPDSVDPIAVEEELRRLLESPGLQHAESLSLLLSYLVQHSLYKPHEHLKEFQLAVDVFGRSQSFDPRLDSTVRVQTSRLRNKLIEYYATLGANDPVIIDIPKGTYLADFRCRPEKIVSSPVEAVALVSMPPVALPLAKERLPGRQWLVLTGVAVTLAMVAGLLGGMVLFRTPSPATAKPGPEMHELRAFWTGFLKSREAPLVIFSNAEFKGRPETGLRYLDARSDSRDNINDLYTGVGEALAISELSRVFKLLNREMVVKRAGLLSWDDTRNRDLIFAGSPTENLSLRDLPVAEGFVFRAMKAGDPRPGDLAIVNAQSRTGEPKLFFATAALPITEDYAVVTLQPGLHPGQSILLLAGTTTLGTQAAAEFVSQNARLEALRKRLKLAADAPFPPFSAVLHVRVTRGVPVDSEIVALHTLPGDLRR